MSKTTDVLDATESTGNTPARSPAVVTSHPLAVQAGLDALSAGGNAVDAAVSAAAVLSVVDPMSTGIGGDCFAMVWDGELHGLNGSGRAPASASIEALMGAGHRTMPTRGPLTLTVPGALDAWSQLLLRHGKRSLADALQPAIEIAANGFEVTPVVGRDWLASENTLRQGWGCEELLPGDRAPRVGQQVRLPTMARTLELIATGGIDELYRGALGQRIAKSVKELGGWLSETDLAEHQSEWVEPISSTYRGYPVYELPPNGQGMIVLQALSLLDEYPLGELDNIERAHLQIEALKLAFANGARSIGDPERSTASLLDPNELETLLEQLDENRDCASVGGAPGPTSDTVYVATTDEQGHCCSLINSIYMHFGSGIVVDGVCLQNRGALFSTDPVHPGALGPRRRSYHTIIPAMVYRHGQPWLVFGVVGGFQQPQGQVQILSNLIDSTLSLQEAIDAPRFRWLDGRRLLLEDDARREGLSKLGHEIVDSPQRFGFGGAQAIMLDDNVVIGATDPRKDGIVGIAQAKAV